MLRRLRNWTLLNPLARFGIAATVGVAIADRGCFHDHAFALLGAAVAVLALTFFRSLPLLPELATLLVFAFGHQVRLFETNDHPLRALVKNRDRLEAIVTGYLVPASTTGTPGDGSRQEVMVRATKIDLVFAGKRITCPAVLRGWMTAKARLPAAGTYEFAGRIRIPRLPTNPGQFDSSAYALRQGFVGEFDIRDAKLISKDPLPIYTTFLQLAQQSREWIESQLELGIEGEADALALIRGMALGVTDETSAEIQRPFKNTGTLHVFSVSGLHVALISAIGIAFLSALGIKRSLALFIVIPGVFAYSFITGWRPSAARAAIMVTVFLAAALFDRRSRIQNSLGAAALILLAADSHQLFTAGFQLSFGVLLAIAIFDAPLVGLTRRWTQLDPFLPPQLANWSQRCSSLFRTKLATAICVSTAATVGSLPLMLWHFSLATPVSILANCLLVPLASFVLTTVCVSLLFATLKLGGALVLTNNANWMFSTWMLNGAVAFSQVPGAWFHWQPFQHSTDHAPIEFTVLNLPYGEAAQHLRVGTSHWLLDVGSRRGYSQIVQPLLQAQNIDTLSGLVLSHSDIEHVGGAARAAAEYDSPPLHLSILEPWKHESGASSLKRLLASVQSGDHELRLLSQGDVFNLGPQASATVLYPASKDQHGKGDDRALVLMLDLDGFRVLWCNDIGFIAEKTIIERNLLKNLRCDVLVRNQHTEDFTALPELLLATRPRIIVTSNVPFLAEQAMPESVPAYARQKKASLLDQDSHGAVTIRIEDDQLTATGFATGESITLNKRTSRSKGTATSEP